jgi:hypothetical protein
MATYHEIRVFKLNAGGNVAQDLGETTEPVNWGGVPYPIPQNEVADVAVTTAAALVGVEDLDAQVSVVESVVVVDLQQPTHKSLRDSRRAAAVQALDALDADEVIDAGVKVYLQALRDIALALEEEPPS